MIEAGRAYVSANKLFVNGVKDLSQQCKKEEMISVSALNNTEQWLIFLSWAEYHIPVNLHISAVVTVRWYKHSCPRAAAVGIKKVANWRCLKWWFYGAAKRETWNPLYSLEGKHLTWIEAMQNTFY